MQRLISWFLFPVSVCAVIGGAMWALDRRIAPGTVTTVATVASILVHQPGTYHLTVTDNVGCQLMDSLVIELEGTDLYGNVTTSTAAPLDDQKVYLIIYNATAGTLTAVDSTQTSPSGFYSFCGISTIATYFVKAAPDSSDYPTEMPTYADSSLVWNNATQYFPATLGPIQVDFSTIPGANPGGPGFIGGLVSQGANKTDGPGDPVEGLRIFLMDAASLAIVGFTDTDTDGYFAFDNLPYGNYKVIPDKPNVDEHNVPVVSIDVSNPSSDSLDFRLHSSYLELVFPTAVIAPANGFDLQLSPNPLAQQGRIAIQLEQAGPVSLELYDMRGKKLEDVLVKDLASGKHVLPWTPQHPPGAYFLRLKAQNQEKILKVLLL